LSWQLVDRLRSQGSRCVVVQPHNSYTQVGPEHYRLNPTAPSDFVQLLRDSLATTSQPYHGIVYLWGLASTAVHELTMEDIEPAQVLGCGGVMHLVQALAQLRWHPAPRVWLVTRGAQARDDTDAVTAPTQASLWGLGRVLAVEHPQSAWVRVDIDATAPTAVAVEALWAELNATDGEDQVIWRQEQRYVARLVRQVTSLPAQPC